MTKSDLALPEVACDFRNPDFFGALDSRRWHDGQANQEDVGWGVGERSQLVELLLSGRVVQGQRMGLILNLAVEGLMIYRSGKQPEKSLTMNAASGDVFPTRSSPTTTHFIASIVLFKFNPSDWIDTAAQFTFEFESIWSYEPIKVYLQLLPKFGWFKLLRKSAD